MLKAPSQFDQFCIQTLNELLKKAGSCHRFDTEQNFGCYFSLVQPLMRLKSVNMQDAQDFITPLLAQVADQLAMPNNEGLLPQEPVVFTSFQISQAFSQPEPCVFATLDSHDEPKCSLCVKFTVEGCYLLNSDQSLDEIYEYLELNESPGLEQNELSLEEPKTLLYGYGANKADDFPKGALLYGDTKGKFTL